MQKKNYTHKNIIKIMHNIEDCMKESYTNGIEGKKKEASCKSYLRNAEK